MTDRPTQIQSVARAAKLLFAVADCDSGLRAKEVAFECGLALPTAYHLLNTLTAEGLLIKDASRRYVLGPRIGVLAHAYLRRATAPDALVDALGELAARTGETVYLSAWGRDGIQVLESVEGSRPLRVAGLAVGEAYLHGHARAAGKLLLALAPEAWRGRYLRSNPLSRLTPRTITDPAELERELALIRRRGFASDEGEFAEGVCCLAVPVVDDDAPLAAFAVSAPADRFARNRVEILRTLRAVSSEARERLGYSAAAASQGAGVTSHARGLKRQVSRLH